MYVLALLPTLTAAVLARLMADSSMQSWRDSATRNCAGPAFAAIAQMTSETRVLECLTPRPETAPQRDAQLYTTYGQLKHFLIAEVRRLAPGRVTLHSECKLLVRTTLLAHALQLAPWCCHDGSLIAEARLAAVMVAKVLFILADF